MSLARKDFLSWTLPVRSQSNDVLIDTLEAIDSKIATNNLTNGYLAA